MKVEVSNGELLDKLTILELKLSNISNKEKLLNISKEHNELQPLSNKLFNKYGDALKGLYSELSKINGELWKIEDDIRECEKNKLFDQTFIDLARSVYFTNDQRAKIKNDINKNFGSELVEVKSYEEY